MGVKLFLFGDHWDIGFGYWGKVGGNSGLCMCRGVALCLRPGD